MVYHERMRVLVEKGPQAHGDPPRNTHPFISLGAGDLACRHSALFSLAASGAYWPIAIHCPSLGPFPSIGSGVH